MVSRRCGWGRTFNVWNLCLRFENGELGLRRWFWNRLSAPWTCLFRQLNIVHGANQREPRALFSVKNDGHQSRGDVCILHQYAFNDQPGAIDLGIILRLCLVSSDTREEALKQSRECRRCLGWLGLPISMSIDAAWRAIKQVGAGLEGGGGAECVAGIPKYVQAS